ncbi:GnsA/GnsB family protein, partial [Escherichia coli]|nr:GnsA/GnsB family protein [Escherichia coli]EFO0829588.1 GnsA/GnsB family protein [Escherichia coli]
MRCFILSFIRLLHIIDTTVYQDSHNRLK